MKLESQIRRVFGLRRASRPALNKSPPGDKESLALHGYPALRQIDFFLTIQGLARWRTTQSLLFPPKCCVCKEEAQCFLPIKHHKGFLDWKAPKAIVQDIPHCAQHGSGKEAKLIAIIDVWSLSVYRIALIGLNEAFLTETAELNQGGVVVPPWQAFPEYTPFSVGWRQGQAEYWMGRVWQPFWNRLSGEEQTRYLETWQAPTDWRAWLL
jgi:hypothetical protein